MHRMSKHDALQTGATVHRMSKHDGGVSLVQGGKSDKVDPLRAASAMRRRGALRIVKFAAQ